MNAKSVVKRVKKSELQRGMYLTAADCVGSMEVLRTFEDDFSNMHRASHLLASTALELFAKSLIFYRLSKRGTSTRNIGTELSKFRHDLSRLYSEEGVGRSFCGKSGIRKVLLEKEAGRYPRHRYVFKIFTRNFWYPVFYDPETIRYGLLSDKKAESVFVYKATSEDLLRICRRVEKEVAKETGMPIVHPKTWVKQRIKRALERGALDKPNRTKWRMKIL